MLKDSVSESGARSQECARSYIMSRQDVARRCRQNEIWNRIMILMWFRLPIIVLMILILFRALLPTVLNPGSRFLQKSACILVNYLCCARKIFAIAFLTFSQQDFGIWTWKAYSNYVLAENCFKSFFVFKMPTFWNRFLLVLEVERIKGRQLIRPLYLL